MRYVQVGVCEAILTGLFHTKRLPGCVFTLVQVEPHSPDSLQDYYSSILNKV